MSIKALKRIIIGRFIPILRERNLNHDIAAFMNDHIGGSIIAFGQYEKQLLESTTEALNYLIPNIELKNSICLDIGANIGNHSLHYSTIFKDVIAFEPNPIAYKLLEANILRNNIDNIKLFKIGLGSHNEIMKLFVNPVNLGMTTLVPSFNSSPIKSYDVEIKRGDELLSFLFSYNSVISFIKIDVEGFESRALIGLKNILDMYSPIISIELNFLSDNSAAIDSLNTLSSMGYKNYYTLERAFKSKYKIIDVFSRIFINDNLELKKIKKFDLLNYQQIFCKK